MVGALEVEGFVLNLVDIYQRGDIVVMKVTRGKANKEGAEVASR